MGPHRSRSLTLAVLLLIGCGGSNDFDRDGVLDRDDCDANNAACLLAADCLDADGDGFRLCDGTATTSRPRGTRATRRCATG